MNPFIAPDNAWPIWAFIIVGTAVCIFCEQNYKWAAKISGPVLSLLIGMFLANFKILPTDSPAYDLVEDYLVPVAIFSPRFFFAGSLTACPRSPAS